MQPLHKTKTKTMKKYIAKFAVVACVAFFALNSQSEAASLHISIGSSKENHCCVHEHRPVVKRKAARHRSHHCCRPDMMHNRRHPVVHNRKEVCRHGR